MTLLQSLILGIVEGLTEYLPVSSTGHLILAAHWLGLADSEAVKTFEVVIQAGAIAAVLGLYRARIASMINGLLGRDSAGRRLLIRLLVSFLPAMVLGLLLHKAIKAHLFGVGPVVAALAVGGAVMIWMDRVLGPKRAGSTRTIESITLSEAVVIGLAQCLAMWPGTSRAMVTILAGMVIGLPATAAAEYSFLLALPTLGAATALDALKGGEGLMAQVGPAAVAVGFVSAAIVAALAVHGFVRYLTKKGLAPFGWYRLILAGIVWLTAR